MSLMRSWWNILKFLNEGIQGFIALSGKDEIAVGTVETSCSSPYRFSYSPLSSSVFPESEPALPDLVVLVYNDYLRREIKP